MTYLLASITSAEIAAWVQAIGSIAAIIAAFLVSWLQTLHERKSNRRRGDEVLAVQLRSLLYTLESISSSCLRLNRKLYKPEGIWKLEAGYLELLLRDLRAVPNQDIPSLAIATRIYKVTELLNAAIYFISILDRYAPHERSEVQRTLRSMLAGVFNLVVECSIEVGALAASRGIHTNVIDGSRPRSTRDLTLMRKQFIQDVKSTDSEIGKFLSKIEAIAEHPDSEGGADVTS